MKFTGRYYRLNTTKGAIIIEGHVQGLSNTRSLGQAGIPVFVVDKNDCIARYSKYCGKFFISPDFQDEQFVPFLMDLGEKYSLKGWVLIPSNDHAVLAISRHKKTLEEIYKVITPHLDIIENIYDKGNLLQIAEKSSIPVPRTHFFKSEGEELPSVFTFPVLTKGRNGLSFYRKIGKKALMANHEKELCAQLTEIAKEYPLEKTFTQELIPFDGSNKTISFTAFCVEGIIKTHWSGVKLREHPLQFGTATFAQSFDCTTCYEQSVRLLKALNYTGVCEVEYLFDPRDKKYKLIEINARTWLWVGLARACGVDYARLIYDFVNNNPISWPDSYEKNKHWFNPISDMVYGSLGIVKGRINPFKYLVSIFKGGNTNALFEKGDFKPGFMYLAKMHSFLRNR